MKSIVQYGSVLVCEVLLHHTALESLADGLLSSSNSGWGVAAAAVSVFWGARKCAEVVFTDWVGGGNDISA